MDENTSFESQLQQMEAGISGDTDTAEQEGSTFTGDAPEGGNASDGAQYTGESDGGGESDGESGNAGTGESGDGGEGIPPELPALPGEEAAQTMQAAPAGQPDARYERLLKASMLALGADSEQTLYERLEDIEVAGIVENEHVPEGVARELARYRREARARDQPGAAAAPAYAATNATGTANAANAAYPEGAAQAQQSAQPAQSAVTPEINTLAQQAQGIQSATGINMLEVLKSDRELLGRVAEYNQSGGRSGLDMRAAYNEYRRNVIAARPRIPANGDNGRSSGGSTVDYRKMSSAKFNDLMRKLENGEMSTIM